MFTKKYGLECLINYIFIIRKKGKHLPAHQKDIEYINYDIIIHGISNEMNKL